MECADQGGERQAGAAARAHLLSTPPPVLNSILLSSTLLNGQAKEEVKKIIATYQSGELEQQPGRTIQESFENRVNAVLNKARDDAGKRAQNSLDLSLSAKDFRCLASALPLFIHTGKLKWSPAKALLYFKRA
eukprot:1160914-Pelagomonas_calceolata.AAC.14